MIDILTQKPLIVRTAPPAGPYIIVTVDQVDRVRSLLEAAKIRHWVEIGSVSSDGGPFTTVINLGLTGDAARVQAILDQA